jgi:hypothetical protein
MSRHSFIFAASIALLVLADIRQPAHAQMGPYGRQNFGPMSRPMMSPSAQPVVSPYINLSNRNPVVNYYGIIRPQLESRSLELQQRQTLQQLERRLRGEEAKTEELLTLPRTGHRSYFMNYSHYYPGSRQ